MSKSTPPVITPIEGESDMTSVTFSPDLKQFGMKSLAETDVLLLLERRVRDIAACNEGLQVTWNGEPVNESFEAFCSSLTEHPMVFHKQVES